MSLSWQLPDLQLLAMRGAHLSIDPFSGELVFDYLDASDSPSRIFYDMYGAPLRPDSKTLGAHEGPLGSLVPVGFDWYQGARQGVMGPYPASGYASKNSSPSTTWGAHNAWSVLIPVDDGAPHTVTNVRVHYDQLEIYHLNIKTQAWEVIRQGETTMAKKNMTGGYYQASPFKKTDSLGSHYRKEESGWSVDLSPMFDTGKPLVKRAILHTYFPDLFPRILLGNGVAKGTHQIAIRLKARLISDDPTQDLSLAKFMGHTSGDMFRDANSSTDSSGVNPPLALPRFRRLTEDWQYFGHVTGSPDEIASYPKIPFLPS